MYSFVKGKTFPVVLHNSSNCNVSHPDDPETLEAAKQHQGDFVAAAFSGRRRTQDERGTARACSAFISVAAERFNCRTLFDTARRSGRWGRRSGADEIQKGCVDR